MTIGKVLMQRRQENFDLQQLRMFEAVYRTRSFRQAADELSLTDSAVSRSIQRLEEDLGFRLFDRTTRSVVATDSAEAMIEQTREILTRAVQLERETERIKEGNAGEVRVGAGPVSIEAFLTPALIRFSAIYRDVSVQVRTGAPPELFAALAERRLDLVLYESGYLNSLPDPDAFEMSPLPEEPVVIVHRPQHPVANLAGDPNSFLTFPWAAPVLQSRYAMRISPELLALMASYNQPRLRLDSLHLCLELAAGSDVITVAPLSIARQWQEGGKLTISKQQFPMTTRVAVYTVRKRTLTAASGALKNLLLE